MNEPDHNLMIRFEELCRALMKKHEILKHFPMLKGDYGDQSFLEPFSRIACCMNLSDDEVDECIQMLARIGKNATRTDWPIAKFYLIIALIVLHAKNQQLYEEYTAVPERSRASKVMTWFEQWKPGEAVINEFTKRRFDMLEISLYFTDTDPNTPDQSPPFLQLGKLKNGIRLTEEECLSERTRDLTPQQMEGLFTLMESILRHPVEGIDGTQQVTAKTIQNVTRLMESN